MKKIIAAMSMAFVLVVGGVAQAAPVPVKVIAETITEPIYQRQVPNGKENSEVGAWMANFALKQRWEFWNVGADGGEQYAEVTSTATLIYGTYGTASRVVTERRVSPTTGDVGVVTKPYAEIPPDFPPTINHHRFTGGPNGKFIREDGTVIPVSLMPDGRGGFTIQDGSYLLVVQNPEAFKDWDLENTDTGMRFSGMTGQVEYCLPGLDPEDENSWKLAKMNSVGFPPGTHIKTSEDSTAILSFSDMSTFVLKPESHVVLDTPPGPESKIKLVAGNIWVNVKKMVKDGSMSMEMNQAVCGIKGTTLVLSEVGGVSSLKVIEGAVNFAPKSGGEPVMVTGGSMVAATAVGIGAVEQFDAAHESEVWAAVQGGTPAETPSPQAEASADEPEKSSKSVGIIIGLVMVALFGAGVWIFFRRRKFLK